MSLETTQTISTVANVAFIISLVVGVVAAFLMYVTANIKEVALKRELAEANERIAEASARGDEANARAAEANEKAEAERLARVKLEARLAPRSLTGAQQQAIAKKISRFAPQQFEFVSYQDDPEVRRLVFKLIETLLAAGWHGNPARQMLFGALFLGVIIEYAPDKGDEFGPAAAALADALSAEGIVASSVANAELAAHAGALRIKVGKKP